MTTPVNPTTMYAARTARAQRLERAATKALEIFRKDPDVTLRALAQRFGTDPWTLRLAMKSIDPSWQPARGGNKVRGYGG